MGENYDAQQLAQSACRSHYMLDKRVLKLFTKDFRVKAFGCVREQVILR